MYNASSSNRNRISVCSVGGRPSVRIALRERRDGFRDAPHFVDQAAIDDRRRDRTCGVDFGEEACWTGPGAADLTCNAASETPNREATLHMPRCANIFAIAEPCQTR